MQGPQGVFNSFNSESRPPLLINPGTSPIIYPHPTQSIIVGTVKLNDVSIEHSGDTYERANFYRIKDIFPNYEIFWKIFIIPSTNRIDPKYAKASLDVRIGFRNSIDSDFIELAVTHYSVFVAIIKAIKLKENNYRDNFEDFYFRLGTVNENMERLVVLCWVLFERIIKHNRSISSVDSLEKLNGNELTKLLIEINKTFPIKDEITKFRNSNRNIISSRGALGYRNLVTHYPKITELRDNKGHYWIPAPSSLDELKNWSSVLRGFTSKDSFVLMKEQMELDLRSVLISLNNLWGKLILNLEEILNHDEYYKLMRIKSNI